MLGLLRRGSLLIGRSVDCGTCPCTLQFAGRGGRQFNVPSTVTWMGGFFKSAVIGGRTGLAQNIGEFWRLVYGNG